MLSVNQLHNRARQIFLLFCLCSPAISIAGDNDEWTVTLAPYLWVTGQEGEVATLPPAAPAELDISFSDVVKDLEMTLMGIVEARKGKFGVFGETFYVSISSDIDTGGLLYSGGDYDQDLWGISLGASYALILDAENLLDLVVGIRYWELDNELELDAGILPATSVSHKESWNDTFIGLRGRTGLGKSWYLTGWGMVAVAGDSDSSWDVYFGAGYDYSESMSFSVGYRHLEVDYDNDDFLYDVEMSGPTIGLNYRI